MPHRSALPACLFAFLCFAHAVAGAERAGNAVDAPPQPAGAALDGRVVDAITGEPLADVLVQVQGTDNVALTDRDGRFTLVGVAPGTTSLYVSVVGYGLARRDVVTPVPDGMALTIPLARGSSAYTEEVRVTGDTFRKDAIGVPMQQSLDSRELQDLRGVLADDPGRAIQVLPGVATSDDFRGEFTVRGSDFAHLSVTFDGVANPYLFHTVRAVDDSGSIALINGDVLDSVTLLSGSYPQRYGGRLGAQVEFRAREGSRERRQFRGLVSGTAASVLAEGPLGASKRGSWLVSARRSYVDWLLKKLDTTNTTAFGFYDVFGKAVFDPSPKHHLELTGVGGRSQADEREEDPGVNSFRVGVQRAGLVSFGWRYTPSSALVLMQRLYATGARYENTNLTKRPLDQGADRDLGWRADVTYTVSPSVSVEAGGQAQFLGEERTRTRYTTTGDLRASSRFDRATDRQGVYASVRRSFGTALAVSSGLRADRWTVVDRHAISPWLQVEWMLDDATRLTVGSGRYAQAPTAEAQALTRAGERLRLERATHIDAAIERRLGPSTRGQIAVYERREDDLVWQSGTEVRLVSGRLRIPSPSAPYTSGLRGRSRGIEFLLQRKSPNGFSGWASYSWASSRDTDEISGETFDRAVGQRHTVNLYAQYRVTSRLSVSSKFRGGDNFPLSGYYQEFDGNYYVSDRRNEARPPLYARVDARANYTFNLTRRRMTLFVELVNALGRTNYRPSEASIDGRTGQAYPTEELFPFLPSAGLLIEF